MSVLAPPLAPIVGLREARIIMLGLDGAGKTTILYKLKLGEIVSTIPTIDFNVENVQYKNMSFTIWDVGGQANIRALWLHHFQGTQGLVFVIDSTDSDRTDEAAGMLHEILREPDMGGVAVLVLANKQDLPHALSTTQLADKLRLNTIRQPWFILVASAATGDGLYDGLDWLAENLKKNTA